MWQLDSIDQTDLNALRFYPGLIGVLIYQPAQKVFSKKIRSAYPELHSESGRALLLFAGFSNWVSPADLKRMREDVRNTLDKGEMMTEFIVALSDRGKFENIRALLKLRERFGLKIKQLPCLVLLEQVDSSNGYVFEFDKSRIDSTNDSLESDLGELFDIFKKEVAKKPFSSSPYDPPGKETDPNAIAAWRSETLDRVLPQLRLLKCFRTLRKNGAPLAKGVVGLGKLLFGGH